MLEKIAKWIRDKADEKYCEILEKKQRKSLLKLSKKFKYKTTQILTQKDGRLILQPKINNPALENTSHTHINNHTQTPKDAIYLNAIPLYSTGSFNRLDNGEAVGFNFLDTLIDELINNINLRHTLSYNDCLKDPELTHIADFFASNPKPIKHIIFIGVDSRLFNPQVICGFLENQYSEHSSDKYLITTASQWIAELIIEKYIRLLYRIWTNKEECKKIIEESNENETNHLYLEGISYKLIQDFFTATQNANHNIALSSVDIGELLIVAVAIDRLSIVEIEHIHKVFKKNAHKFISMLVTEHYKTDKVIKSLPLYRTIRHSPLGSAGLFYTISSRIMTETDSSYEKFDTHIYYDRGNFLDLPLEELCLEKIDCVVIGSIWNDYCKYDYHLAENLKALLYDLGIDKEILSQKAGEYCGCGISILWDCLCAFAYEKHPICDMLRITMPLDVHPTSQQTNRKYLVLILINQKNFTDDWENIPHPHGEENLFNHALMEFIHSVKDKMLETNPHTIQQTLQIETNNDYQPLSILSHKSRLQSIKETYHKNYKEYNILEEPY